MPYENPTKSLSESPDPQDTAYTAIADEEQGHGAAGAGAVVAAPQAQLPLTEQELNYLATIKAIIQNSGSYTLSRLPPALNFIATAVILKFIGADAIAAGSVLSTAYFAPLFIARGPIMVLGPAVSAKIAAGEHEDVSSLMQSGYAVMTAVSLPIIALFAASGKILPLVVEEKIAHGASQYLLIATSSVIANLLLGTLQQFTLAAKQPKIALISSTATLVMANALAALFALYFKMGLQGMALGYAFAFNLNLLGLIAYLKLKSGFEPYKIFDFSKFKVSKADLKKLLGKGSFVALQQACDPGNLLAISIMMAKLGTTNATAQEPTQQLGSIFPTVIAGFGQALAVMIGGINAKRKKALAENNVAAVNTLTINIKKITLVGSAIAFAGATLSFAILAGAAKQLTNLLIDSESQTQQLAIYLLQITGISMLFDSLRITGASLLRGFEDVAFPSLSSTVLLNIFGLIAGGLLTLRFHQDPEYLFITRTLALLIAAVIINLRLCFKLPAYMSTTPQQDLPIQQELSVIGDEQMTAAPATLTTVTSTTSRPSLLTRLYRTICCGHHQNPQEAQQQQLGTRLLA